MRRTISSILLISFSLQIVTPTLMASEVSPSQYPLGQEDLIFTSQVGTLTERAYMYRQVKPGDQMSDPKDRVEHFTKKASEFERLYRKHELFVTDAQIVRDYDINDVELKKDIVKLVNSGIDGASAPAKATPIGLIAKTGLTFIKGQIIDEVMESFDSQIEGIEQKTKEAISYDLFWRLNNLTGLDNLNLDEAIKKYKELTGSDPLILNKDLAKRFHKMSPEEQSSVLNVALKQSVVDMIEQHGSAKSAFVSLDQKFSQMMKADVEKQRTEGLELLIAKELMISLSTDVANETKSFSEILGAAVKQYASASTSGGILAAQGVMTHAKLDMILGDTGFLVAEQLKSMSATDILLLYEKRELPENILAELNNKPEKLDGLKLQAQKEKIAALASDFQIVAGAMMEAAVALGLDDKTAQAMNAAIGIVSGALTIAAVGGPVGWVVGAVMIICSVAGLLGRKKKRDNSMQQLMLAIRQISQQVDEIKKQIFELKYIVTKQHAELMHTLDLEFGKTKESLERISSMFSFEAFEKRYGSCLQLENDLFDWMKHYPERLQLSDTQYIEFLENDLQNGELFSRCLNALNDVKNAVQSLGGLDYFMIFAFSAEEQQPDDRYNTKATFNRLKSYGLQTFDKNPDLKKLNHIQKEVLLYKTLQMIPKTYGWEQYKNTLVSHLKEESLVPDQGFQLYQQGIISASAVFHYVKALTFLNQFAPYLNYRGKIYNAAEKVKKTIPGRKYFPESATAKIGELVDFVKPYVQASIAQESLLSGTYVADHLAKRYVSIEEDALSSSNRYWSQENDVGLRFEEYEMVASNSTLSQNFLSLAIIHSNPSSRTDSLMSFHQRLRIGNSSTAEAIAPSSIELIPHEVRVLEVLVAQKNKKLVQLLDERQILLGNSDQSKVALSLSRKEGEISRLTDDVNSLKKRAAYVEKNGAQNDFYFGLPTSLKGDKVYATISVADTDVEAYRYKYSERLHQLLSVQNEIRDLWFDYNWQDAFSDVENLDNVERLIGDLQ